MVHVLDFPHCDTYRLIIEFFINKRHDFFLLLVDILDLSRNNILFVGPILGDVD